LSNLEANSTRLWNVSWDVDALCFADANYTQAEYNDNHRGPITKKLDLNKMSVMPMESPGVQALQVEKSFGRETLSLKMRSEPVTGARQLAVFRGTQSWPLIVPAPKEKSKRPLRTYPPGGSPWSYCFVEYPGMDSRPHVLIGLEDGTLFEGAIETGSTGDLELHVIRFFLAHSGAITGISVSPDGRRFATSSLDGTMRIWALNRPRVLADVDLLTDGTRVVISNDDYVQPNDILQRFGDYTFFERLERILEGEFPAGRSVPVILLRNVVTAFLVERGGVFSQVLAQSQEQVAVNVNLKNSPDLAEPLLNVFVSGDGEWVAWNDQGFYNATPRGARHVGFHRNRERHLLAEFYSSDQFRDYYRPDLVLEVFRSPDPQAPVASPIALPSLRSDILAEQNSQPQRPGFEEIAPPSVRIVRPETGSVIQQAVCEVEVEVGLPAVRRLETVEVRFNQMSQPATRIADSERTNGEYRYVTFRAESPLEVGDYELTALANHDVARGSSPPVKIQIGGSHA
ncbi:MAG: hypothetical protein KDA89_25185, partial [Planctomycetaceae bacterium]|nr:hypothetical protein [Planctomycetaceae bacterium]